VTATPVVGDRVRIERDEYEAAARARGTEMTEQDWASIQKIYRDYPLCAVCDHPMVAGQSGSHLGCRWIYELFADDPDADEERERRHLSILKAAVVTIIEHDPAWIEEVIARFSAYENAAS
jgi:hypothetical protein